ncbi:hypothetical protein PhaeoP23_01732 [Phaeobacter piscinae]|uniref:Copper chaperone PCu(A)C n=1 Tax=Phaeobacter piscinae TaxID=1580596 RepID=A0ABN5DJW3_9RHOB|nr:hypothetical protein PhaeoP36_01732 [Phaeobacter piscinae]AUQ86395.1 hypothetical protein PhaeoP42_01733 [Phaeobacter piscinae]AUR24278.1 hypothetical protein PhaeoP23_01732 [Phaeobacter piscinae]
MNRGLWEALGTIFLSVGCLSQSARADGLPTFEEAFHGVAIENVQVYQAKESQNSSVNFVIENASYRDVYFERISSDVSAGGELFYGDTYGERILEGGLTILREETLDLSSSHIGARLTGLTSHLAPGDHLTLRLFFRTGQVKVTTHVTPRLRAVP